MEDEEAIRTVSDLGTLVDVLGFGNSKQTMETVYICAYISVQVPESDRQIEGGLKQLQ